MLKLGAILSDMTSLCDQFLDGTFTHEKYVCFKVLGEKGDGLLFIFMLKPSYLWTFGGLSVEEGLMLQKQISAQYQRGTTSK